MSQQLPRVQADPATLATILRLRYKDAQTTVTQREYVRHHDFCQQCHTAADASAMCSLGKHLYRKLTRGGDDA